MDLMACNTPDAVVIINNLFWLVILLANSHYARKLGIWDGAFNKHLPDVKKAMEEYSK